MNISKVWFPVENGCKWAWACYLSQHM